MAWSVPSNVSSGAQIQAATTNAILADLALIGDAWTSYTPTLTNITQGNGTVDARYINPGKLVVFQIRFTFGSTSSFSGRPTFTVPVSTRSALWGLSSTAFDTSASAWYPVVAINTSGSAVAAFCWPTTAGNALRDVNATTPMTWASGDILTIIGAYEAA